MAIADKLRKAASLFVVMDEKPAGAAPAGRPTEGAPKSGAASASGPAEATDDLDRRLAQMNATIQQLNTGMADAAAGGASGTAGVPSVAARPGEAQNAAAEGSAAARTIDDLLRETEGPSLNEIAVPAAEVPAPTAGGEVDFAAIYQAASLPGAPFTAEQTLEMLNSLPANLPLEMKRQTVNVTIAAMGKSIGTTPESIVADASRKLAALASYEENFTKQTDEFVAAAEFEISGLLQQVEEKRKAILDARQRQAEVVQKIEGEGDRLDDILEFFSLDIGPSKYASDGAGGAPPDPSVPPPLPPAGRP
ncbi:MAG TPA: hypothetical protein VM490_18910 [Armatimonadaceae bacterium]|nr:hypothetical protein [Armatimonadaceae bacterium]